MVIKLQSIWRLGSRLGHYLTQPSPGLTSPEARSQARLTASLLIGLVVLVWANLFLKGLFGNPFQIELGVGVLLLAGYASSRSTLYRTGAFITVLALILFTLPGVLAAHRHDSGSQIVTILTWQIAAVALSWRLFSWRMAAGTAACCVLALILFEPAAPDLPLDLVLAVPVILSAPVIVGVWKRAAAPREAVPQNLKSAYQTLFQQTAFGVYTTAVDGGIVTINPGLALMLGYDSPENAKTQIGQIASIYVDSCQHDEIMHQLESEGSVTDMECEWRRQDGNLMWVSQDIQLIRGEDGRIEGSIALVKEVTVYKLIVDYLQGEKSLMDSLMDSVTDSIYFKDHDCRLIRISRNMIDSLAEEGVTDYLGKTDKDLYGDQFGERTLADERQVIESGEPLVGLIENRTRANGSVVWSSTTKAPLRDANGEIVGVVGITRVVNDIMEAREALRESEENARLFQEQLKTLHEVSIELSRADSFDALSRSIVELGCRRLGFDRLGLWYIDPDTPEYMIGSFGTNANGEIEDNRTKRFKIGSDTSVGRTLTEKRPVAFWQEKTLYGAPGEVLGQGSHAMAILWDGDKDIGLLTADNLITHRPMTQNQLELLRLYSVTAGHLYTRKQVEEALRANQRAAITFQERLKWLHEVSIELSKSPTFDDLCRNAITLGRERLYFERLGLWFWDRDDLTMIIGSFGTDEHGHIRDERQRRLPADRSTILHGVADQQVVVFSEHTELFNDQREIVGYGSKALAFLWDGDRTIGWLTADNLLSGQPMDTQHLEILRLYTLTLAQLCTRKRAEDALREKEELLRRVIDADPNNIYVQDADGRYILVNEQVSVNFGLPQSAILGKTNRELGALNSAAMEMLEAKRREVIEKKQPSFATEISSITVEGEQRWFLVSQIPLSLEGNPDCLLGVGVDITAQKRAEAQRLELVRERERVQVLQRFMSGAAHDLITPLTTMKTSLYLMRRTADDARLLQRVDVLESQTTHIEDSINNLLKIARLDRAAFHFLPTNLDRLAHDIVIEQRQLIAEQDRQIELEIGDGDKMVMIDSDEFRFVVRQMLANAVAYSPPGKAITVQTARQDNQAVLVIIDEGEGIAPEDLTHIFEPFYRAEARESTKGGFGLGLTIAKWVVEAHGGEIDVESTRGVGSTFRVTVPLLDSGDAGAPGE